VQSRGSAHRALLTDQVRSILDSKRLTLSRVSQISAERFGRRSGFFLPHTLYHQLRLTNFSPSTYQLLALSNISGYRFSDWFRLFGFNLEQLPTLQLLTHSSRTVILDSSWVDSEAWIRWPRNRREDDRIPSIAPLTSLVELSTQRRIASIGKSVPTPLYARIGSQDALGFPDLLPGSIVRVNPHGLEGMTHADDRQFRRLFLIEHSKGLFCCRLRSIGSGLLAPISNQLSFAQVELEVPGQVRVLGAVDLEIRSLFQPKQPEVPPDLARYWPPQDLTQTQRLGDLLRTTRSNRNMSLRDVEAQTRRIADLMNDSRYVVSSSGLSDCELTSVPPRDFHKSIAVSLAYGVEFRKFLDASGISLERAGQEPMPDHFASRVHDPSALNDETKSSRASGTGFLEELLVRCGDIPFFLRDSIPQITALPEASLDSWFWIGRETTPLYPYLANGLLVAVNRRKKRPIHFTSRPAWQQPVYLVAKRDGTYMCACCGVENGTLVVHPYATQFYRSERIRYHQDAEIVGQIVAVVRRLP
jgi:hypothetical protein